MSTCAVPARCYDSVRCTNVPCGTCSARCRGLVSLDDSLRGLNGMMPDTWMQTGSWGKVRALSACCAWLLLV